MSDTPETDAELIAIKSVCKNEYMLDTMGDFARKLERERDEARRKLEDLDVAAIHTCHDQCQRPMCVLRRERDELLERNAKLRDIADRALMLNQTQ
jgi:hypothetical protein